MLFLIDETASFMLPLADLGETVERLDLFKKIGMMEYKKKSLLFNGLAIYMKNGNTLFQRSCACEHKAVPCNAPGEHLMGAGFERKE
jgi:hypothetical protein